MSIATEISRLRGAKDNIKSSIELKGVTIPSDTTLSSYSSYIDQIPTGGSDLPKNLAAWGYDDYGMVTSITYKGQTVPKEQYKGNTLLSSVTFTDSVETIGEASFSGDTSITTLKLGKGLKEISNDAFNTCQKIDGELSLYEGLERLGDRAFNYCSSIKGKVTLPSSLKYVGAQTFSNNFEITEVEISDDMPSNLFNGTYTFSGCKKLSKVNFPTNLSSIVNNMFADCSFTKLDIPSTVKTLGNYSFSNNKSLTELTLDCESIGTYAFNSCSSLKDVIIGDNVQTIGNSAFNDCINVETIFIGSGVTNIGSSALRVSYSSPYKPTNIIFKGETPPTFAYSWGWSSSGDYNHIFVPCDSVDAYKNANNIGHPDRIVGYTSLEWKEDGYFCQDGNKYAIESLTINGCDGDTYENIMTRKGALIEENSDDCMPKVTVHLGDWIEAEAPTSGLEDYYVFESNNNRSISMVSSYLKVDVLGYENFEFKWSDNKVTQSFEGILIGNLNDDTKPRDGSSFSELVGSQWKLSSGNCVISRVSSRTHSDPPIFYDYTFSGLNSDDTTMFQVIYYKYPSYDMSNQYNNIVEDYDDRCFIAIPKTYNVVTVNDI